MRPLLDGGASAVKDHRPGRKASGGTKRAIGMPSAEPSAPAAPSGSSAPLTAKSLIDAQSLMADELPDGLVIADDPGRRPAHRHRRRGGDRQVRLRRAPVQGR